MPWVPRPHRPHARATHPGGRAVRAWLLVVLSVVTALPPATAEQPPAPCHPNATAVQDVATVLGRDDVTALPTPLQERLAQLADRPHSILPLQVYAEAEAPSQLLQYYLLDTTGFERLCCTNRPGTEMVPGTSLSADCIALRPTQFSHPIE